MNSLEKHAQTRTCSPHEPEDLSLDPENPCEKLVSMCTCDPSCGAFWTVSLVELVSSGLSERLS